MAFFRPSITFIFSFSLMAFSTPFSNICLMDLTRLILVSSITVENTGTLVFLYFALPILNFILSKSSPLRSMPILIRKGDFSTET